MFRTTVECRGAMQKVTVVDFSISGLRIDGSKGLAAGDPVWITFRPDLHVAGKIAWAVWHKAGIKLQEPLSQEHPAYIFLIEQAEAIERTRTLALVALAKDRARG